MKENVEQSLEFRAISKFVRRKFPWIINLEVNEVKGSGIYFHYIIQATIDGVAFLKATNNKISYDVRIYNRTGTNELEMDLCVFSTISCLDSQDIIDEIDEIFDELPNSSTLAKLYDAKPSRPKKYLLDDEFKIILPGLDDIDDDVM